MIVSPHDILHKLITVLVYYMAIFNLKIAAFLEWKVIVVLLPIHRNKVLMHPSIE